MEHQAPRDLIHRYQRENSRKTGDLWHHTSISELKWDHRRTDLDRQGAFGSPIKVSSMTCFTDRNNAALNQLAARITIFRIIWLYFVTRQRIDARGEPDFYWIFR